jgi:hypothetical protein
VEVFGTQESCCPASVPWTITGANGKYVLKNAGPIIHLRRIDLRPMSLQIVGTRALITTMAPSKSPLIIPMCERQTGSQFGGFLRFTPSPAHRIQSARDVDYDSYGFQSADGGSLESWFGPTAANVDTFKDRYVRSKQFAERAIFVPSLGVIGIDASGTYLDGRRWRWVGTDPEIPKAASSFEHPAFRWHLSVATNGIGYDNASAEDQKVFDAVIDSACTRNDSAH